MIPDSLVPFANHVWQSTLFAVAVWLMILTLRKNRASVRHRLWLAASVKFLVPFSLLAGIGSHFQWQTAPVSAPFRVSMIVETVTQPFSAWSLPVPPGPNPALPAGRFSALLIGVWICGVAASLFWWSIRWWQVHRVVRRATASNLDGPLRVMYGPECFEPGVFGILRPVLLLPQGITRRLSPAQLEAVLAHELCHVRRRDNLAMAIHLIAEALFWFHPLVWCIRIRLLEEQERACDEEVLRLGGDPQVYAASILKICELYLTSPLTCVSGIAGSNLKKRIEDIMRNRMAPKLSLSRALFLAVVAIAALAGPIVIGIFNVKAVGAQSERSAGTSSAIQEYRVGEIRVTGAKVLHNDVIRSLLGLVSGEVYNESRLVRGVQDLMKLYGSLGYINFMADPRPDLDEQRRVVNLNFDIREGRQFIVNRITFTGNTATPDEVIRREIFVNEGQVFNTTLWNLSVLRLNQLGVFEDIKEQDSWVKPSPSEPKVDIALRVKEKGR